MKETSLSFDSTWLSMVRLAKGTTTTQPAFNFYQNEDGNFCLRWCCRSLLLFHCCLGQCQSIVCITCPASVARVTRGTSVMWLYFSLFFCKFFIVCFVAVLDVIVVGDLRHEYAQSAWGFPFRGSPDYWLHSSRLHCGDWCSFDDDCRHGMSIVVILTMSSWRLCCVHWQGCLVAPRLIATALLIVLEECLSWALWHFTMMALIAYIAISDGFDCAHRNWQWRRCPVLLATTVPSSDACVVFTARIIIV